jgi:oligopeptide/dipeptide ABC transporter ATP-binding protein
VIAPVLLEGRGLVKHFPTGRGGRVVQAVSGVDIAVRDGETLAIVGESGCGKSTLGRLLLGLLPPTKGEVRYRGRTLTGLSERALRPLRREMQIVFQDPFSSLNPRLTVGEIVGEPLWIHEGLNGAARRGRVAEILDLVGLRPEHADRYPHEFSGGQRQRIGIARALASGPSLIVGDEPVSALDVSVQAQIINLLVSLKERLGLTLLLISHDLAVVRHMSDRVAVMYLGEIVEEAPSDVLFAEPRHPYTQALLASVPLPSPAARARAAPIEGDVPSPAAPPPGCRFHTRCPHAQERCIAEHPVLADDGVACHFWRDIAPPADAAIVPQTSPALNTRLALWRAASRPQQPAA